MNSYLPHGLKKLFPLVKLTFYLLIVAFMAYVGYTVYEDWQEIDWTDINIHYRWLPIFLLLASSAFLFYGLTWQICLRLYGEQLSLAASTKIYIKSQLGKYIPGKIGLIVTKVLESGKYGLSQKKALAASSFELGVQLYTLLIISVLSLLIFFNTIYPIGIIEYSIIGLLLIVGLLSLTPRNFIRLINQAFIVMGKQPLEIEVKNKYFYLMLLINTFNIALTGLANFYLIKVIFPLELSQVLYIIGVGNIAFLLGLISVFTPSGFGIRESVWIYTLSLIMPATIALVASVILRVGALVVEWGLIGLMYIIDAQKPRQNTMMK